METLIYLLYLLFEILRQNSFVLLRHYLNFQIIEVTHHTSVKITIFLSVARAGIFYAGQSRSKGELRWFNKFKISSKKSIKKLKFLRKIFGFFISFNETLQVLENLKISSSLSPDTDQNLLKVRIWNLPNFFSKNPQKPAMFRKAKYDKPLIFRSKFQKSFVKPSWQLEIFSQPQKFKNSWGKPCVYRLQHIQDLNFQENSLDFQMKISMGI